MNHMEKITYKDNYRIGILLMLASTVGMSLLAVIIKYERQFPLMEIVLFRSIPTIVIIPIILRKRKIFIYGNNKTFLLLRGFFGIIGMIATFYAYTKIPITEAIAIQQLNPFFVVILSYIVLKEKLYIQQFPIFLIAFIGGLMVIKPGVRIDLFPVIICLLGTISISAAHVTLRYLRLTDHSLVIVNYFAFITSIISLGILLKQGNIIIPKSIDLLILILLGFIALFGQITLTKSYQMAKANLVSLYGYFQIVFAGIFGFLFFKEFPDIFSIIGVSLIIISGYLNYKLSNNSITNEEC